MKEITTAQELIESGILELYVLEQAAPDEVVMVEELAAQYPEITVVINDIATAFENYATANAVAPNATLKPFVMASLNYIARMEAGEQPSNPPLIHAESTIADYEPWLSRPDLQLKEELKGTFAYIIGYTPEIVSAIAWIEPGAELAETHDNEHETFFIVEGSCCITFGGVEHHLVPGQCLNIPLHLEHTVRITSQIPCKVILQRMPIAA